jgi:hypothetical protein
VIGREVLEPALLIGSCQVGCGCCGEVEHHMSVRFARRIGLTGRLERCDAERANRLQQAESRFAAHVALAPHEASLDQSAQSLEDVHAARDAPADGFGRLEREATHEHGKAPEQSLLGSREQLVTPANGSTERLMPFGQIARTTLEQIEPPTQSGEQCLRREEPDPRRRQLERERQAIEPCAQFCHCARVVSIEIEVGAHGPGSLDE